MSFIRRHPFLLLGLLTLTLFFAVEALNRAGYTQVAAAAAAPLRVLIVPMYVVWLPFTMLNAALIGPDGTPSAVAPLIWTCGLVAGLGPYVLVDYLLALDRRWRGHRDAGT
jgi:hypothetical protein